MELWVDGLAVSVSEGTTVLEACDAAGRYVPRLCAYPGLGCGGELGVSCGLCAVLVEEVGPGGLDLRDVEAAGGGEPQMALACCTRARPGMSVVTAGAGLRAQHLTRLAAVLRAHPHVCLTCPDRDGCTRDVCTFGIPPEARCCDEFGRCELGKIVAHVDPGGELPRRAVVVRRDYFEEGRIRREPGLCIGCGRCVIVCGSSPAAGAALRLELSGGRWCAVPKAETLRASGCTFCGQCVMVCPAGAVTAPGEAGARWLAGWRERTSLAPAVLPPDGWRPLNDGELAALLPGPGVFVLADGVGKILKIAGVANLAEGVAPALAEPACREARRFRAESAELFTQRESELLARFVKQHGHLPPGNDLGDDLFADDLLDDDLE